MSENKNDDGQAGWLATHHHAFRCGEVGVIETVTIVTPEGCSPRPCLQVKYADGVVDFVPLSDVGAAGEIVRVSVKLQIGLSTPQAPRNNEKTA